ncbi:MAG: hypothetical protein MJZ65_00195 [Paludibacteraceae bacterium]|nr:hypothetical protein [Paludibacteraceae bacterium]
MKRKYWIYLLFLFIGVSCEPQVVPMPRTATRQIVMITAVNGLGDHGYIDLILLGAERVYLNLPEDVYMLFYSPTSFEQAEQTVDYYASKGAADYDHTLIILAGSDYEPIMLKYMNDAAMNPHVDILAFEMDEPQQGYNADRIAVFSVDMYKGSYDAGVSVAQLGYQSPLIWLANENYILQLARDGFSDGYFSVTGVRPDTAMLSTDWRGYGMPDVTYQQMAERSQQYDFIYPVMGGSNMGIYRYLREHPEGPKVAGMDVDQSQYASNVIGSLVKHMDQLVEKYLDDWLNHIPWKRYEKFEANSGYIEWVLTGDE